MEKVNKRAVVMSLMGAVITHVVIFSMNPIAMGYFASLYLEKSTRFLTFLGISIGLVTIMPMEQAFKYGMIMLGVILIVILAEKNNRKIKSTSIGVLTGFLTTFLSCIKGIPATGDYTRYLFLAVLEGVLVIMITNIFQLGTHYFLYAKKGQLMNNEELISVTILIAIFIYGLPRITESPFSIIEAFIYLFILFMGYKYGAGAGAITGAVCGIILQMQGNSFSLISVLCILGIFSGMFREVGRIGTAATFLTAAILMGYLWENSLWEVTQIRALLLASVIFLFIPGFLLYRVDLLKKEQKKEDFIKHNLQSIAKRKLEEFSESFYQLSKSLSAMADTKKDLNNKDLNSIFEDLSQQFCKNCKNCDACWISNYYDTCQFTTDILNRVQKNGMILASDVPSDFASRCVNLEAFITETNKQFEVARLNLEWYNRMAEGREAIAEQLGEVAELISDFSDDLYSSVLTNHTIESAIIEQFRKNHIDTKRVTIIETKDKRLELFLMVKTKWGRCITTKEAAILAGDAIGRKLKPSESTKTIISKNYAMIILTEDTNFKILTGVAKITKDGEKISGDNFSFLKLDSGQMIMILSDGMGAGVQACEESRSVIELLEQFLEAGFKEESSIKLINSTLVLKSDQQSSFSTIDMAVINLFTGMCNFVKVGAAAAFIKREGFVETIHSNSLPIGMFNEVDFEDISKKLYSGDIVVMITDGVLDCIEEQEKEEFIEQILMDIKSNNPQEIADIILEKTLVENQNIPIDDMTILVAGLWKK